MSGVRGRCRIGCGADSTVSDAGYHFSMYSQLTESAMHIQSSRRERSTENPAMVSIRLWEAAEDNSITADMHHLLHNI